MLSFLKTLILLSFLLLTGCSLKRHEKTDYEKIIASDSFKRVCVNWGIGRELYTSPFIYIPAEKTTIVKNDKGKYVTKDTFHVEAIKYNKEKEITALAIKNQHNKRVFLMKPQEANDEDNK